MSDTRSGTPIGVAVVGAGFFGAGLLRRLAVLSDFEPRIVANRTIQRALAAYQRAGVDPSGVIVTDDVPEAQSALDAGRQVATTDLELPAALHGIDVVAETTGDLLVGTTVALAAINHGKHLVAANSDVQATVGLLLSSLAARAGVVYTDIDGDEPGLLKSLFDSCTGMGLEIVLAGSGKGVLKRHATPETQAAFASANRLQPWLATAAADGTKLNFEMTVVANATGLVPKVRGMHGPSVDLEHIVEQGQELMLLDGGHYVDYVLGGRGVFVVARSDDPEVRADFSYLKLGDGPYYLFHRAEVMAHYSAVHSLRRAVRNHEATVAPLGKPVAETVAFAKRNLEIGHHLDGIGGFDSYGLIATAQDARTEQLLPIGIAQYARLCRPVLQDEPIRYEDVVFDVDNLALQLRRQQDALFAAP